MASQMESHADEEDKPQGEHVGQQRKMVVFSVDNTDQDDEGSNKHKSQEKRRWRYVVLFSSFCILFLEMGSLLTVGVYLIELREQFDSSAGQTGWMASSALAVMGFSSLISGIVVKRFGCRRTAIVGGTVMTIGLVTSSFASSMVSLFLTLSLITGVGAGLTHVAAAVVIEEYFTSSYTFANGLAHVGPGVGLVVYPPLIEKLIDTFGWRGSFIIEGAIVFHIVAAACLLRPLRHSKSLPETQTPSFHKVSRGGHRLSEDHPDRRFAVVEEADEDQELRVESWKTRTRRASAQIAVHAATYIPTFPIVLVCLLIFLTSTAWLAVLTHGVAIVIETGVSDAEASLVLSVIGASSIFSRITHGWCIDRGYISVLGTEVVMLSLATVMTFTCILVEGFTMYMAFATCVGFASGVFFTLIPVIVRRIDTKARFPHNFGLVFAIGAVGDLCAGYFAGLIRDVTGSYTSAFYFSGGAFALATTTAIVLYVLQKRGHQGLLRRKSFSVFGSMGPWAADIPLP